MRMQLCVLALACTVGLAQAKGTDSAALGKTLTPMAWRAMPALSTARAVTATRMPRTSRCSPSIRRTLRSIKSFSAPVRSRCSNAFPTATK